MSHFFVLPFLFPKTRKCLFYVFCLTAVSSDGTAKLWDCGTGTSLATIATTQCPINACALHMCSLMASKNTLDPVGQLKNLFHIGSSTLYMSLATILPLPATGRYHTLATPLARQFLDAVVITILFLIKHYLLL